jgi:HD superfamily phosphodiesterase
MILETIAEYVRDASQKPDNALSPFFFNEHVVMVLSYAEQLCGGLQADHEVVSISAYLHDISAVIDIASLPKHNLDSAERAGLLLNELGYSPEGIREVKECIVRHVNPIKIGDASVEAVVLSNADAMSQIANPAYWLYFVFKIRTTSFEEGRAWYANKIESNWISLVEPAKILVHEKYLHVRDLLKS